MYITLGTRPDIAYAVQQLCRYLNCYRNIHWEAAKCIICYLKGTCTLVLTLGGDHATRLHRHTDSDFAACIDTQCLVSSYCFLLGLGVITWSTRQQRIVTLSSCENEYIDVSEACQELTWICTLLTSVGFPQLTATPLMCDNCGVKQQTLPGE